MENCLLGSLRTAFSTAGPYSAADGNTPAAAVKRWFDDQFNYSPSAPPMPLRSMLVAAQPGLHVHAQPVPQHGACTERHQLLLFGDRVTAVLTGPERYRTAAATASSASGPSRTTGPQPSRRSCPGRRNAYWAVQPWTSHPTKINVNTATFGQLWAAYYAVMAKAPAPRIGATTDPDLPVGADTVPEGLSAVQVVHPRARAPSTAAQLTQLTFHAGPATAGAPSPPSTPWTSATRTTAVTRSPAAASS